MKRGDKVVFVFDDLGYELDDNVDAAPLLEAIGFSSFDPNPCLQCGHSDARVVRGLLTPSSYGSEDFAITDLSGEDFVKLGGQWRLRPEVIETLAKL